MQTVRPQTREERRPVDLGAPDPGRPGVGDIRFPFLALGPAPMDRDVVPSAFQEGTQPAANPFDTVDPERQSFLERRTADAQGEGQIVETHAVARLLQPSIETAGLLGQGVQAVGRERDPELGPGGKRRSLRDRRRLFQHQVAVRAGKAHAADGRAPGKSGVLFPGFEDGIDVKGPISVDRRIRCRKANLGRDGPVAQRHQNLDQRGRPGRRETMPEVGLR